MNKQELVNDLKSKDFVEQLINEPKLQREDFGVKWYTQEIFEIVGNAGTTRTIHFFVLNEGTAEEKAVYKDRIPEKQSRGELFKNKIQDKLSLINGKIEEINEDGKYAIVKGYVEDSGKMIPKRYLIKYIAGNIVKTEITETI